MLLFHSPLLFEYAYVLILLPSLCGRLEKRRQKSWVFVFLCLQNSSMEIYELCVMLNGEGGIGSCVTCAVGRILAWKMLQRHPQTMPTRIQTLFNVSIGLCRLACGTKAILIIILRSRGGISMLSHGLGDFATFYLNFPPLPHSSSIINANKFVSSASSVYSDFHGFVASWMASAKWNGVQTALLWHRRQKRVENKARNRSREWDQLDFGAVMTSIEVNWPKVDESHSDDDSEAEGSVAQWSRGVKWLFVPLIYSSPTQFTPELCRSDFDVVQIFGDN
jgi:hypothetical protein